MKAIIYCIIFLLNINFVNAKKYDLYREHFYSGLQLMYQNYYLGASGMTFIPVPYIDLENENWTIRGDKGLLYRLYENNRLLTMIGLYYYVPRTSSMDEEGVLDGLDNVEIDFPLVYHSSIYLGKGFEFIFRLEQGLQEIKSQKYFTYFTYNSKLTNEIYLEVSAGINFASKGYINNWFGISQEESLNNNHFIGIYNAEKNIDILNTFMEGYMYYDFSYDWSLLLGFKYTKFVAGVLNSPIIKQGSNSNKVITSAITYKF